MDCHWYVLYRYEGSPEQRAAEEHYEAIRRKNMPTRQCPDCDSKTWADSVHDVPEAAPPECDTVECYECDCGCVFSASITDGEVEINRAASDEEA